MLYKIISAGVVALGAWLGFRSRQRKIKPHPKDLIFSTAQEAFDEYSNQSLQHFASPLGLEPLTYSPAFWQILRHNDGLDDPRDVARQTLPITHLLLLNGEPTNTKLKMKLSWLREDLASPVLLVWQGRDWIPLRYWLSHLGPPKENDLSVAEAYALQEKWWRANGRSFRFGELPSTARKSILGHMHHGAWGLTPSHSDLTFFLHLPWTFEMRLPDLRQDSDASQ